MTNDTRGHVIWHTTMSLDGLVADPGETMSWVFDLDTGGGATARFLVPRLGALLVGRRTMSVEDDQQPGFYGSDYSGPFFVLTSTPQKEAPVVKGVKGAYVIGPIEDAVATALMAAEGKDVAILGPTTATSALEAGLVDELVVHVAPILLGGGIPLSAAASTDSTWWRPVGRGTWSPYGYDPGATTRAARYWRAATRHLRQTRTLEPVGEEPRCPSADCGEPFMGGSLWEFSRGSG